MPRTLQQPKPRYKIEEKIFALAFAAAFSLLFLPSENVSGSPVPKLVFNRSPNLFHTFVLDLNFAFFGAVMTIFLRNDYPNLAACTRLFAIVSMAVSVGIFSWLAGSVFFRWVGSVVLGNGVVG